MLEGSIPESIVAITNLEILDISRNEMGGGFPDGFTGLGSHRILDVPFNFCPAKFRTVFRPISESIGFDALVRLDAFQNTLTVTMPAIGFLDILLIRMLAGMLVRCSSN